MPHNILNFSMLLTSAIKDCPFDKTVYMGSRLLTHMPLFGIIFILY